MTLKIGPRLESGANLPDIAMILATNWQNGRPKGISKICRTCTPPM